MPPTPAHHHRPVLLTREQARQLDRLATDEFLMPSIVLMENAAVALARAARAMLARSARPLRCVIVCGPGNNGGDGFALSRHLSNAGIGVCLVLSHPRGSIVGDAGINLAIAQRMGLAMVVAAEDPGGEASERAFEGTSLIVDALLGTGLDRPVTGEVRNLIELINRKRSIQRPVLAVDLPSGVACDSGHELGLAVRADTTVTFAGLKPAMLSPEARPFIGEVIVGDIGVPAELVERLGSPIPGHHD